MAKYMTRRQYVPPSPGKTVLVHPSKNKEGVLLQDWDVYIGHGLNNKHWVLEKSKWSNPFYTTKLSSKSEMKVTKDTYSAQDISESH